jgi:ribokinase
MTQAGVIVEHLVVDRDGSTGIALITVDQKGENEIVVVSGSNMKLTAADVEKRGRVFSKASVLLVQLEIPLDTLIASVRMAKQKGLTVVLNPAPARRIPRKLLSMVDYLTPNASEAGILTGMEFNGVTGAKDVGQRLLSLGVGNVILTLGEKGCLLISRETQAKYPAFKVKPVDTTAAGDAFNGGLAFALARGDSTENAIRIARAVAAISVTRVGAQSSMPTLKEVEAFLS